MPSTNGRSATKQMPELVQRTRAWVETGGSGGDGNTEIKQIGDVLMPSFDSPALELLIKGNTPPEIEADMSYLIAEAVEDGEIDFSKVSSDASFATNFLLSKTASSYSLAGKGREQVVEVLRSGGARVAGRFRRMFGRGNAYEGGGFDDAR